MTQHVKEIFLDTAEYEETFRLRAEVLLDPFGISHGAATNDDAAATHLAIFSDQRCVACLMLVWEKENTVRMRQVAVATTMQRSGLGRCMIEFAEERAHSLGYRKMIAAARETAVPFYLALGYQIVGEPFTQVGLPHRQVEKPLKGWMQDSRTP